MNIDDLKGALGSVTPPEKFSNKIKDMDASGNFIAQLKKNDERSKHFIRRFYIAYFIIAAFYFGLFILNPDPELKFSDRLNGTLLFLGILLFAVMGKKKFTALRRVNYDEPSRVFLAKALERYKFWNREMNYGLALVILVNIGSCRSFISNYPIFENPTLNILAFELVFVSVSGIAMHFGYQHWRRHKKPLADEIFILLKEAA